MVADHCFRPVERNNISGTAFDLEFRVESLLLHCELDIPIATPIRFSTVKQNVETTFPQVGTQKEPLHAARRCRACCSIYVNNRHLINIRSQ